MVVDQVPSQTYVATSNSQIQLYGSQPMSPVTPTTAITPPSATSSGTQSSGSQPFTDPLNLPNPSRQLRPPKIPLYVPAVLRPTERPSRPSSLTPPQSLSSSADTARSLEALNGVSQHWTRDRPANFVGPGRFIEDEWSYNLGDVNGPPTRDHWKPSATHRSALELSPFSSVGTTADDVGTSSVEHTRHITPLSTSMPASIRRATGAGLVIGAGLNTVNGDRCDPLDRTAKSPKRTARGHRQRRRWESGTPGQEACGRPKPLSRGERMGKRWAALRGAFPETGAGAPSE
ncbi:MAG: hypothetical protein M4579_005118 [Chaenotheca gracillima]|nr:MAG: hypothetical protein M4579_005118 [Chaenotheca gracillima]